MLDGFINLFGKIQTLLILDVNCTGSAFWGFLLDMGRVLRVWDAIFWGLSYSNGFVCACQDVPIERISYPGKYALVQCTVVQLVVLWLGECW